MDRVLVNDRCLYRSGGGVATYLREVLAHWPGDADLEVVGYCRDRSRLVRTLCKPRAIPAEQVRLRPLAELSVSADAPQSFRTRLKERVLGWYGSGFAKERRRGYAVYFEPNHVPVPCEGLTVTTCHDLSVLEHPEWHPADRVARWGADMPAALAATDRWLADSEFTRGRMIELLGVRPDRVDTVHLAARPLPYPGPGDLPELRGRLGLPKRYLLHLGTLEPRKNLPALLDAWAQLDQATRDEAKLVFAGGTGWGSRDYWRRMLTHDMSAEVLTTGYIDDAVAAALLAGAEAVVIPSFYEGFGLPILEAMACGTPVICSTAGSFDEVADQAADRLSPTDTAGWASAMDKALTDSDWRQMRRRQGLDRVKTFTWRKTARQTAEILRSAIDAG